MSGIFQEIKKIKSSENLSMESVRLEQISRKDIAIIGIHGRISKANNIEEYWNILCGGKDCIRKIPEYRSIDVDAFLNNQGIEKKNTEYTMFAYMDDIDKFDYKFFSIAPNEASLMDPAQRLFLETAINAIEDAGYGGKKIAASKTGVYVGYSSDSIGEYKSMIFANCKSMPAASTPGNIKSIIAGRVSYTLDLKGPAVMIDTACSSSLVAVHYACQGIRNGECDMAIAGGVSINLLPSESNVENGIGIVSSNGRTRTFDDASDGTGGGEGVVAIILKPLSKALNDGDNIYAIIKGSAINQDGTSNGITSPNSLAQRDVIISAWRDAGIDPQSISYIEAHGTGTKLGDPIEIDGIQRAFRTVTNRKQFCAVGAVKTNIGHLDSAAGIVGLIKAVLALKHKKIPPTLHFNKPNSKISFEDSPIYINDRLKFWEKGDTPRRCGVSAFGFSGTNCHIVLEEAKIESCKEESVNESQIITFSAKTETALKNLIKSYKRYTEKNDVLIIDNICYTANTGRGHYNCRLALVLNRDEDLNAKVSRLLNLDFENITEEGIYYGKYTEVSDSKKVRVKGELTREEKEMLDHVAVEKTDEISMLKKEAGRQLLEELAKLYIQGAEIPWEKLYQFRKVRKTSLPLYPFERLRCWLETSGTEHEDEEQCYTIHWKREELSLREENILSRGAVLVIKDSMGIGQRVIKKLQDEGNEIIEVELSSCFRRTHDKKFEVGNTQSEYDQLIKEIKGRNIKTILHFASISDLNEVQDIEQLNSTQEKGFYSLFYLVKSLMANSVRQNTEIVLVSKNVNEVTSKEKYICPENASLFGLGKVVHLENESLNIRCIDIDEDTSMSNIISEIKLPSSIYITAYRQGVRYVETIDSMKISNDETKGIKLKKDGVYIVTGGMGGIGLAISRYLASKEKINLILISKSDFPEREEWDNIIAADNNTKLISKLKTIKGIESNGSKVAYYSADVSNMEAMQDVLTDIGKRFTNINGIIHGAGVAGDGFLINKDRKTVTKVTLPKIHGTWAMDKLTENHDLDFFILLSSITSILGAPGQGDYTAANAYLDSFTSYRNKLGRKTITLDWATWSDTGMAVDHGIKRGVSLLKPISTPSALKLFGSILDNYDAGRFILGELDYDEAAHLPEQIIQMFSDNIRKRIKEYGKNTKPSTVNVNKTVEVMITGDNTKVYTDVQRKLAEIWSQVLGVTEISIYDNFNEIGGNSILAVQLYNILKKEYPSLVDMADIFTFATIAELSEHIEKGLSKAKESNIDNILERLASGELSVDEVEYLIEETRD